METDPKQDLDRLLREAAGRMESGEPVRELLKEIEALSKPLHTLVIAEKFTVDDVVAESYATSFTPSSERRIGGRSPVYSGGFSSSLVLQVTPYNPGVPVKILNFKGISAVRAGDVISAQIPRYEEKRFGFGIRNDYDQGSVFYLDREFKPEESAIELAILSDAGKVLRRDRAVNYKLFVK